MPTAKERLNLVHGEWARLARELRDRDQKMRPIIDAVGMPTPSIGGQPFRALAESILSQQLATKAASAIIAKFTALERPFPRPQSITRWTPTKMRKAGVSGAKARYLKSLASRWTDKSWRRGWEKLEDVGLIERLTEVHGIGEWTAQMFLIFQLGRPDILATGDYGIRRALGLLHGLPEAPAPKQVRELVVHWKGMASVGSWYLWRALDRELI